VIIPEKYANLRYPSARCNVYRDHHRGRRNPDRNRKEEGLRMVHSTDVCPVRHLRSRADLRTRCLCRTPCPDIAHRLRLDAVRRMADL